MEDDSESESTEPKDPREKLDQILRLAEKNGSNVAQAGRKLTEEGQSMSDIANATRRVVTHAKDIPNIESLIINWETANHAAEALLANVNEKSTSPLISGSSAATFSSTDYAFRKEVYSPYTLESEPELSHAITVLSNLVTRASHKDEVVRLMELLGLDKSPKGIKSPLELFQTAHESFSKPVVDSNPIITSLLPMRESVRLTIDYLLKHRPKQEKTNKEWDKIISIGNQLSHASISEQQIRVWAGIWIGELKNSLSPAKEQDISRDEWSNRITKSTLFLKSFLSGIDPAKLK